MHEESGPAIVLPGGADGGAATVVSGAGGAAWVGAIVVVVTDVVVCLLLAVDLSFSSLGNRLPMTARVMSRATKTPTTMSRPFLSECAFFGGSPHSWPFQYDFPPVPAGSGYQPGGGDGGGVVMFYGHVSVSMRTTPKTTFVCDVKVSPGGGVDEHTCQLRSMTWLRPLPVRSLEVEMNIGLPVNA